MRNQDRWIPSKFVKDQRGDYHPNMDFVNYGSWYICNKYIIDYETIIREHSSGRFLDCGCGEVPYYEIYKPLVERITCVDWDNTLHDNSYVDCTVDLNTKLPFDNGSFDTILVADVLEHIYQPKLLFSELSRVLSTSGKALIMVPFYYYVHEKPYDYFRYTEYALKNFCTDVGLKPIYLEPYGGLVDVMFDLLNKVLVRNKFSLSLFKSMIYTLKLIFPVDRFNKKTKHSYPLGYCLVAQKI